MQPTNKSSNQPQSSEENMPNAEELAKIFDYPAIGELFSEADSRRFDNFCSRLAAARENLERIVRHGDRSEAEKANRAIRGIDVTADFLQSIREMQAQQKA